MSEEEAIAATEWPATVASLTRNLWNLGVAYGDIVIVHSSLSALGFVIGGAQAVVQALLVAVGPEGTIVMPTHSSGLSDPADWSNPPVPEAWFNEIREQMPAFDRDLTPTREMGQIVECFRRHPGALRSDHPQVSFAALGPAAVEITISHPLTPALGEGSPLARLYDLDAKILLLGVGHEHDTSMHLAEYRAAWDGKSKVPQGAPISTDGFREWMMFEDLDLDSSDFGLIGEAAADAGLEVEAPVGAGIGRLSRVRPIVDFAANWMTEHRPNSLS